MLSLFTAAKKSIGVLVLIPFLSISVGCVEPEAPAPIQHVALAEEEIEAPIEDNVCPDCDPVQLTEEEQLEWEAFTTTLTPQSQTAFIAPIIWLCRIAAAGWKAYRTARKARLAWNALTTAQKCRRAGAVAAELGAALVLVNQAIQSLLEKKRDCGLTPDEQKLLDELIQERNETKKAKEEAERLRDNPPPNGQCEIDDSVDEPVAIDRDLAPTPN